MACKCNCNCPKNPGDCQCCGKPSSEINRTNTRVVTPDGDSFCSPACDEKNIEDKRYSWL